MKWTPRRVFSFKPSCSDDQMEPSVNSLLVLPDGHTLVLLDGDNNHKVKVLERQRLRVAAFVYLAEGPLRMALLPDGLVAVTTRCPVIYLLQANASQVSEEKRLETGDHYYSGVGGLQTGHLVVCCNVTARDGSSVARVDIIDRSGAVVRTVNSGEMNVGLKLPSHLFVACSQVYLSLDASEAIHRLDLVTGRQLEPLQHADLKSPRQVVLDHAGFVYVASSGGRCVLVCSPTGEWRKLVTADANNDVECKAPRGLCVTDTGRLVVAWCSVPGYAVITGHQLENN
jgi:hypothetical protein